MSAYCKRAHVLFTKEQYQLLAEFAQTAHKAIGTIIRESVEKDIIAQQKQQKRRESANRICSMNLPTIEWDEFKKELVKAHTPGDILEEESKK